MKKIKKKVYVIITVFTGFAALIGSYITTTIHSPEILETPLEPEKTLNAEKFSYEIKNSYDSHSEMMSDRLCLKEYAENYSREMESKAEESSAVLKNFDHQYKKYKRQLKNLERWEKKLLPDESEKAELKENLLLNYGKDDEENISLYNEGRLSLDEAIKTNSSIKSLDKLYQYDYRRFCEIFSDYGLYGWFITPEGNSVTTEEAVS